MTALSKLDNTEVVWHNSILIVTLFSNTLQDAYFEITISCNNTVNYIVQVIYTNRKWPDLHHLRQTHVLRFTHVSSHVLYSSPRHDIIQRRHISDDGFLIGVGNINI